MDTALASLPTFVGAKLVPGFEGLEVPSTEVGTEVFESSVETLGGLSLIHI